MKISSKIIKKFVELAGDRLTGDWVIIGGAVLQLLQLDIRVTTDIDLSGPESATQKDTLILMDIASELRLPVESINQAACFFLQKIDAWEKSLVLVHKGRSGQVFRPDINLFLRLKIQRLTTSDLDDCLAMISWAADNGESLSKTKMLKEIRVLAKAEKNSGKIERLEKLTETIQRVKAY